jgi:thioredoxin 1
MIISSKNHTALYLFLSATSIFQLSNATFITLETTEQYNNLIKDNIHLVLQFSAPWCGACKHMKQLVEDVAQEPEFDTVTVARIDADKFPALVNTYRIRSLPTFVYVDNGNAMETFFIGSNSEQETKENLRTHIRNNKKKAITAQEKTTDMQPEVHTTDTTTNATASATPENQKTEQQKSETSILDQIKNSLTSLINALRSAGQKAFEAVKNLLSSK